MERVSSHRVAQACMDVAQLSSLEVTAARRAAPHRALMCRAPGG